MNYKNYKKNPSETLETLFRWLAAQLRFSSCPFVEARLLLQLALGLDENSFFKNLGQPVRRGVWKKVLALLKKRKESWPMAYLAGKKEFWSLEFKVNRQVLIPRPETEILVEKALSLKLPERPQVLDVGTGCGNIAVALGREWPEARITACDLSLRALKIARENAARNKVKNIYFVKSNLLNYFIRRRKKFDLIVSNPPYISEEEWPMLDRSVRDFEPRKALVAGPTGLEIIKKLIMQAPRCLKRSAYLLIEVGSSQAEVVLELAGENWQEAEVLKDYAGFFRAVCLRRK
ncbi:MAG: peptide chain release factor N(5)-glutamine methyltransferase [Candidatus Aminicenantes bacterium]|nr:peptide chain release factor N(5)-glutamine methyltransferase [Candidatus Aminicenantes bacterium]